MVFPAHYEAESWGAQGCWLQCEPAELHEISVGHLREIADSHDTPELSPAYAAFLRSVADQAEGDGGEPRLPLDQWTLTECSRAMALAAEHIRWFYDPAALDLYHELIHALAAWLNNQLLRRGFGDEADPAPDVLDKMIQDAKEGE
jgi:hypothetical protein